MPKRRVEPPDTTSASLWLSMKLNSSRVQSQFSNVLCAHQWIKMFTRTAAFHAGSQTKILLPGTYFHMFSRNLILPTPASPTSEAEIEGDALTKQRENTTRNTSPSPAGRHQLIMQHSQLKTMNESGKVQPNQSATNINSETFNGSTSQEKNAASLLHKKSITSTTPFSVSLSPKGIAASPASPHRPDRGAAK